MARINHVAMDSWMFPLLQSSNKELFQVKVTLTEDIYNRQHFKLATELDVTNGWEACLAQSLI